GGHLLLPEQLVAACGRFSTPSGPRSRGTSAEEVIGHVTVGDCSGRLVALRIAGAGPGPATAGDDWATGLVPVRLAVAEAVLRRATDHLQHRSVQGTTTLGLPMVRALVADAAASVAEARALTATVAATGPGAADDDAARQLLRRAHRALDACGRTALHLLGATGYLTDGPGSTVRASELLADAYAPAPTPLEA
ncbi:acyl-CoA dehydrogenase family protein, partial [Streptomyces sp. SM14]|uniref:acyl-CoA dehydrogenase family protein n=1 Tax=Streptomyces sp. SM14 TaxID=1736045 RepID=UPI000CD49D6D